MDDDHLLVLDEDGSRSGCSAVSSSLVLSFSDSFSDSLSFCDDAPSSTSTSCVRGEDVTHDVQINVIRSKKEILRRFADCLPSLLLPDIDDGFSLVVTVPLPFPLPLLRLERALTGTVIADAVHERECF